MNKKTYKDWSHIDLMGILDEYGIEYSESGKNIGTSYFGIETCPFCSAPSNHFGVRLDNNVGGCFVCGETATVPKLVHALINESWSKVYELLNQFSDEGRYIPTASSPGDDVIFPENVKDYSKAARDYLQSRKFNPDEIIQKYRIKSTGGSSYLEIGESKWDFSYRIIIPIIMERRLVAYTGRTFVDSDVRYSNSPIEACIASPASCLYNIDTVTDKAIFVEGVTDVWRLGKEAVGTMGIKVTKEQIAYIGSKDLKEAYVLFDNGAEEQARKLAYALSLVIDKVKIITLTDDCDPGDLADSDAMNLKYSLLGRV